MASITKRGKTYQFAVSNYVDGKSRPIRKGGFRTKKEAEIAAAELEARLRKSPNIITKDIPFNDYFKEYVEVHKANLDPTTKKRYMFMHTQITNYFGDTPIQKIARNDYQKFINWFGEGRSRETVRKANNQIGAAVRHAIEDDIIFKDFTNGAQLVYTEKAKSEDEKYLHYHESERLYRALLERLEVTNLTSYMLLLALASGARYAEIIGLTDDDFDFEENTINIYKTWKYRKEDKKEFGPLKPGSKPRRIKIEKEVMEEFKFLISQLPHRPHDLIFYSSESESLTITNNAANKVLRKVLEDLGIDYVSMHALRHTNASTMIYKGVSIYTVSKRLGHSDVSTTQNVYTHLLEELAERDEEIASNLYSVQSDVQN